MPNIWGTVGGVQYALPMATLLGTAYQLLGMSADATQLEYKNAFYNNTSGQFYVPNGAVGAPSYSFSGDLTSGWYRIGAGNLGLSILGVKVADWNATRQLLSINLQMSAKLIEEDFGADIVAAAAIDLTAATGNYLRITNAAGAINLADLGGATLPAGTVIETHFVIVGGSVTLIYDVNILNLLGGVNLLLQDGDVVRWRKTNDASNYWKMVSFARGFSSSILTTKGDLLLGLGAGATSRKGVGADGTVLTGSAADPTGVAWVTPALQNIGQCRLVKNGANLQLNPFNGNKLVINSALQVIPDAGVTLAPPAVASTLYYIYAYMVGAVMTLEQSATVPVIQAGTGVYIKTADATRTLVGMARTTAGNAWADTATQRFVRSWFNDGGFAAKNTFSVDRTTVSAVYAEINAEIRTEFLVWAGETVDGYITGGIANSSGGYPRTAIAFDGAVAEAGFETISVCYSPAAASGVAISGAKNDLAEGYHYATLLGDSQAGTTTWYAATAASKAKVYLHVATSGH